LFLCSPPPLSTTTPAPPSPLTRTKPILSKDSNHGASSSLNAGLSSSSAVPRAGARANPIEPLPNHLVEEEGASCPTVLVESRAPPSPYAPVRWRAADRCRCLCPCAGSLARARTPERVERGRALKGGETPALQPLVLWARPLSSLIAPLLLHQLPSHALCMLTCPIPFPQYKTPTAVAPPEQQHEHRCRRRQRAPRRRRRRCAYAPAAAPPPRPTGPRRRR
jgi:hypothetical protein